MWHKGPWIKVTFSALAHLTWSQQEQPERWAQIGEALASTVCSEIEWSVHNAPAIITNSEKQKLLVGMKLFAKGGQSQGKRRSSAATLGSIIIIMCQRFRYLKCTMEFHVFLTGSSHYTGTCTRIQGFLRFCIYKHTLKNILIACPPDKTSTCWSYHHTFLRTFS